MLMRQRIQAIQTIKKITHAMRLISMSSHSRMKNQEQPLNTYQKTISVLIAKTAALRASCSNELLQPAGSDAHTLIILIGSQKGLCAGFNTLLMQRFHRFAATQEQFSLITVGKRATQLASQRYHKQLIATYDTFGTHNLLPVAQELLNRIANAFRPYSAVYIVSNTAPTFFTQKPHVETVIPATAVSPEESAAGRIDYTIEQPAQEISDYLTHLYLLSRLQHALFQSLLAEHAARFISMDSSTRNAETLLEKMQLDYNKLRQANITRELTELSAFFLQ
jgi:F-type H+-transporting ATPase subunit gamma